MQWRFGAVMLGIAMLVLNVIPAFAGYAIGG